MYFSFQAFQIANLIREYSEVLNAAAEEIVKQQQLQLTNGVGYVPVNATVGVPNLPPHPNNQIKYPPKNGPATSVPFRHAANSTLVAPQPS